MGCKGCLGCRLHWSLRDMEMYCTMALQSHWDGLPVKVAHNRMLGYWGRLAWSRYMGFRRLDCRRYQKQIARLPLAGTGEIGFDRC